jgi:hypothetical protein
MSSLTLKVGVDSAGVQAGLASAERIVGNFTRRMSGALAAGFGASAMIYAGKQAIDLADRFDDLSKRFSVSASSLQLIGNVAKQEGADIDGLNNALKFLGKNAQLAAQEGGGPLLDAFAKIGLNARDLKSLKADEIFFRLADAFRSGKLAGEELAVASKLLGRGFEQAIPILKLGREEIERIGKSKGVFSDTTIKQLSQVKDLMEKINNLKTIAAGEVAFGLAKSFKEFLSAASGGTPAAALKESLFGPDQAPAAGRSGGGKITQLGQGPSLEQLQAKEKQDEETARFELRMLDAFYKGQSDAEAKAREHRYRWEEEAKRKEEKAIEDAADQERRYQEELFRAEMDALEYEENFRRKKRLELEEANQSRSAAQQQLSGGLLGSSRAGQQAMGAAEKSRGVQVSRENFQFQNRVFEDMATAESNRTGLGFTKQDMRKRVAAEEAARANPSMLDKAQAAGLGMDASDYAGQKARFKSSLGNAAGFSSQEIDSQFRNKLQKDAAQQKQGAAQGGGMEKLLQDVLNKLTSAPVITV